MFGLYCQLCRLKMPFARSCALKMPSEGSDGIGVGESEAVAHAQ
ncbi:hypothetical protein C4H39_12350 [Neisseria gonorrhoeae]|uniref:Uncharacterized protein n=1 Tax=Neisseria gonorrhoeae (strain NCCP11945) TaxID=521006 RepID=B4RQF1_NEIG2|nr:hypothetical protein [Neisseria gonorrhoeae]ACF30487.1 Conserved hypothetical protein [Neisseria gonorrhoeae NCCP11945]ARB98122.1 hypothetical protein A6J43_01735 [Neisseria gonorrhoeae]ASQ71798.1 hypothetical protein BZG33_09095 [Neisseria gonorrhoeae]ASQ74119.1 hypothetical protein BZG34_09120 [Neisseria gonorrhoeae]AZG19966.1 hypothetical protein EGH12_01885 [Neisseria gonorrhoeae]